jgi:hypothetical protein
VRHNVGDDFVREGLVHLLRAAHPDVELEFDSIHKHAPVSARRGFEWVRRKEISQLLDWLPLEWTRDRLLECDLLVQSGAPVYWCHALAKCCDNEWYGPLIERRWARVSGRVPFLNLAAGTCQPYDSDGGEFLGEPRVVDYIRSLHSSARATTVRDRLAADVLRALSIEAPLIPCSSIFARDALGIEAGPTRYVALNFMPLGGHYDLQGDVRPRRWEASFRSFYRKARKRYRFVFVCHSQRELRAARRIDPAAEVFHSRDFRDYVRVYAGAATGISNRVHGAFAIASFGRPAFVIGNDTRSRMAAEIGLRHCYVDDATPERLQEELERNLDEAPRFAETFADIKARARAAYLDVLAGLTPGAQAH